MAEAELAVTELAARRGRWRTRSWRRRSCGAGGAGGGGAVAEAELAEAAEAALTTTQLRWRPGWRRWSWCDEALARRKPRPFTIILERRNAKAQNSYRERISQILLAQMESNAMMGGITCAELQLLFCGEIAFAQMRFQYITP